LFFNSAKSPHKIPKVFPIANFGFNSYLSIDEKILVITELALCVQNCKNCINCMNVKHITENQNLEMLIINKLSHGSNEILNNLSFSLLHLRVGEAIENYNLLNLPFSLKKLELYDQKIIDSTKIKLPIDCSLSLITPIVEEPKERNLSVVLCSDIILE